jgi:site-specific DNA recombinase
MRAAIYARVSTGRQERDQTVDSQLAALRQWAEAGGHDLDARHVFTDEGCSGARLDRPGLDRLRDAAREGEIDVIAVFTPDRLARRYAYQVLLLEEFRKAGCAVEFVQRPIGDDPHDHLLLQIQGAIAEYERAVLGERFRRGKLQKARAGQWLSGEVPYGYRYVCKRDGVPGHVVIDEAEAEVVRTLYRWLIDEQMSVRQISKRLAGGPWRPRCGSRLWSKCVIHHILADPFYTGVAYVNRYAYVVPRRRRTATRRPTENVTRQPRPPEEWIAVPVPAIIDEATHRQAAAQLARNATRSFRNNRRHEYLLRCLLACRTCGRAMFGLTYPTRATGPAHSYYKCHGKDADSERICPQRRAKVEELDAAVWGHVTRLLDDPATLLAQFEAYARRADAERASECAEEERLAAQLRRLDREEQRLVDAYQAEAIDLAELQDRRSQIAGRRGVLKGQYDQQVLLRSQRQTAQQVLLDVTAFCERVRAGLGRATFADRQRIVQLLIDRIIVGEDSLEIRHVIPLRGHDPAAVPMSPGPQAGPGGPTEVNPTTGADERLRTLGVCPTAHMGRTCRVERVVTGISIGVDEAPVAGEERLGELLLATNTEVEHRVRVGLVAHIHPSIRRAARIEQGDGRVVGVQGERGPHAAAHEVVERGQQLGTAHHLIAERRARHVPTQPSQDAFESVERQMIEPLRDEHVRQQAGADRAARDRLRR